VLQARPETVKARARPEAEQSFRLKGRGRLLASGRAIGHKIGTGTVRVVAGPAQMSSVRKGDVLVTDMTDPNWEPVMKLAAAIVTNAAGAPATSRSSPANWAFWSAVAMRSCEQARGGDRVLRRRRYRLRLRGCSTRSRRPLRTCRRARQDQSTWQLEPASPSSGFQMRCRLARLFINRMSASTQGAAYPRRAA
jgi:hypothetical protein